MTYFDTVAHAMAAAAASGDTVTMLDNSTENITVASGKSVTLDLNGHVLKGTGSGSRVITLSGSLTLQDSGSSTVHYYVANDAGPWTWNDNATGTVTAYESLTARPKTGDVIAVSGGAITGGNSAEVGGAILVNSGAVFTMNGGNIVGNKTQYSNGGALNATGACTLNSGNICGNFAGGGSAGQGNGGALYLNGGGSFEMNGGTMSFNTANRFGGCATTNSGFTMNGGSIAYNKAVTATGGAFDLGNSTFTMNSGEIKGNISSGVGGAMNAYSSTAKIYLLGGSITQNISQSGGSVNFTNAQEFKIGGTIVIDDNHLVSDDGTECNLYLASGKTVSIDSTKPLTGTASVGVTTYATPTATNPVAVTTAANSADYSGYQPRRPQA